MTDHSELTVAKPKPCEWTEDADAVWNTGCGNASVLEEGSPADNDYKFCCYCGGAILQCSYQEPPVEEDDE
jgi:hypothetical protein